jgi:COP9 signalosome complex subunit 4
LFITEIDPDQADTYLKKCIPFMREIENKEIQLRYRRSTAVMQDARRDFLNAARNYYQVSAEAGVDAQTAMELYNKSVTCAILSDAGHQKSRMLNILYKDSRIGTYPFNELLKKMTMSHIIRS